MSSEEDFEDSEDGDFSVSEDEWKPSKADAREPSSSSDFEDSPNSADVSLVKNAQKRRAARKNLLHKTPASAKKRRGSLSLRTKLYKKYKPPPKSLNTRIQKPSTSTAVAESDSSSDDDDLVDPNTLDLGSDFFKNQPTTATATEAPQFDCMVGVRLSDPDSDENDDEAAGDSQATTSHNKIELNQINEFNEKLERAKSQMAKAKFKPSTNMAEMSAVDVDIGALLSLGEGASNSISQPKERSKASKSKRKHEPDSDDDWEDVEEADTAATRMQNVEITVGKAALPQRKKLTQSDLEICLKRKMNRHKREIQEYMHKVHLMAWVAYGNRLNRILNNHSLMQMALKMLPSKESYPKGEPCQKYFESLVKWFKTKVQLKLSNTYPSLSRLPPIAVSLGLQIRASQAICYRDLVFIFVILLRAMGIQCRVVMNFQAVARKPAQGDLCALTAKETEPTETATKKTVKNKNEKANTKHRDAVKSQKSSSENPVVSDKKASKSNHHSPTKSMSSHSSPTKSKTNPKPSTSTSSNEVISTKKCTISIKKMKLSPVKENKHTKSEVGSPKKLSRKDTTRDSNRSSNNDNHSEGAVKKVGSKRRAATEEEIHSAKSPKSSSLGQTIPQKSQHTTKPSTGSTKTTTSPHFPNRSSDNDDHSTGAVRKVAPKRKPTTKVEPDSVNIPKSPKPSQGTHQPSTGSRILPQKEETSVYFSPRKTRSRANLQKTDPKSQGSRNKQMTIPQLDGLSDLKKKNTKSSTSKGKQQHQTDESDSDFEPSPAKKVAKPNATKPKPKKKPTSNLLERVKVIDRRVLSTDDEANDDNGINIVNSKSTNFWPEVYCEKEQKWVAVDLMRAKVDAGQSIARTASKPLIYVYAWGNSNGIRDVTPRYNSQIMAVQKARVDKDWLEGLLDPYFEPKNTYNIFEDVEFNKLKMEQPLPTSISEFKNHPLYALERHLLKFEGLYPPDAPTLGFIRGEPVYARECVHTMHSREIWVKQARVVKPGETAYKIVKARPKWDRATNTMLEAQPLEIFGYWQTKPYEPPVAENGMVPRNPYGNVELFKPEMLPIGTRHLQLPSLQKTCKKMNVDCAQAMVGFDFHSGSSHPVFDGFVVCEEFADAVVEQWYKDQEEAERKEAEKIQARVWGNWKKLIKGLFIRERLKRKFNFSDP